jgi:hypothetical protein
VIENYSDDAQSLSNFSLCVLISSDTHRVLNVATTI